MGKRGSNITFLFPNRFDLKDEAQRKRLQDMDKIFTDFGPNLNNPVMLRAMMLPRQDEFELMLYFEQNHQAPGDYEVLLQTVNLASVQTHCVSRFIARKLGSDIVSRVLRFYEFFKEVYAEHERTFDPAHIREAFQYLGYRKLLR